MRCLEITFIPPGFQSGGNLGVYQSIYSLANIAEVDYIGPAFNKSIFPECRKRINIFANLEPSVITVKSLFRLFKGISTNYYDSWRKVEK